MLRQLLYKVSYSQQSLLQRKAPLCELTDGRKVETLYSTLLYAGAIIQIVHSREGDSKNVHPEEMIIDRGEADF